MSAAPRCGDTRGRLGRALTLAALFGLVPAMVLAQAIAVAATPAAPSASATAAAPTTPHGDVLRLAQGFGALRRDGMREPLRLFDARASAPTPPRPGAWASPSGAKPAPRWTRTAARARVTFRTVLGDGSLGESFTFQRDAGSRVVSYRRWNQTWGRVDP